MVQSIRNQKHLITVIFLALLIAGLFSFIARQPQLREWLGPAAGIAAALGAILTAASAFTSRASFRWIIVVIGGVLTGWAAWYPTAELNDDLKSKSQQLFDDDRRLQFAKLHLAQITSDFPTDNVLTKAGSLLSGEFNAELTASDFAKHRRQQDFGVSQDLIDLLRFFDKKNGHAFYYQGEIDRKIGRSDNGHQNFFAYINEEPLVPHARDGGPSIEACRSPRGYCLQRTAWINHLVANDFYEDATAKAAKNVDQDEIRVMLGQALKYGCEAINLYNKSGFADPDQLKPTIVIVNGINKKLGVSKCPDSSTQ
jgi:hypothetical protein